MWGETRPTIIDANSAQVISAIAERANKLSNEISMADDNSTSRLNKLEDRLMQKLENYNHVILENLRLDLKEVQHDFQATNRNLLRAEKEIKDLIKISAVEILSTIQKDIHDTIEEEKHNLFLNLMLSFRFFVVEKIWPFFTKPLWQSKH